MSEPPQSEPPEYKQFKKDRILMVLTAKDASYPAELAKDTGLAVNEVNSLLEELISDRLVEKIVSKYYQLTYAGYKLTKSKFTYGAYSAIK